MKIDDAAVFTGIVCGLLTTISSYFIVTHNLKSSAILGVVIGVIVYIKCVKDNNQED